MKKGFTLIELLVVVLIIGILSAIALPQYKKAVLRARLAEVPIRVKAMRDAADLYVLENGYPLNYTSLLSIYPDLGAGLNINETSSTATSKYTQYIPFCQTNITTCQITVWFYLNGYPNGDVSDRIVYINAKTEGDSSWTSECNTFGGNSMAYYACTLLEPDRIYDN